MKKQVIVLSLGGSLIVPDKINISYLQKFKSIILKNSKDYKFIIVCGGGNTSRKYSSALKKLGASELYQNYVGISATRMNARFMSYFFNKDAERGIPHNHKTLKKALKKHDLIFCGALEYKPNQTSDSTAAELAKVFKTKFINLTNIKGLYTDNPLTNKNAKFVPKISWQEFNKTANKIKFTPGQHFVLDQTAAKMILKNKTKTYIIGKDINQLNNLLKNKNFTGTTIEN